MRSVFLSRKRHLLMYISANKINCQKNKMHNICVPKCITWLVKRQHKLHQLLLKAQLLSIVSDIYEPTCSISATASDNLDEIFTPYLWSSIIVCKFWKMNGAIGTSTALFTVANSNSLSSVVLKNVCTEKGIKNIIKKKRGAGNAIALRSYCKGAQRAGKFSVIHITWGKLQRKVRCN